MVILIVSKPIKVVVVIVVVGIVIVVLVEKKLGKKAKKC